jgi:glycosyltransferase involved in cell wall biosynthesis
MRIAMLLLNQGRGSGEVARNHARFLIDRGHELHFAHPRVGDGVPGASNHDVSLHCDVMPVHEYLPSAANGQKAVSTMSAEEAFAYLPAYEATLESVADSVDLFYGHHANLTAIATANVARRHNKPYVLFLHGTGIEPRLHGGYDDAVWESIEAAISGADGIIVTTEYVRDELVRAVLDVPLDRFIVLPCGVDLDEFRPGACGDVVQRFDLPDSFVICPGALMTAKGPQNVVAASEVYADESTTVFIGDGELRAELEAQLGERGRFLGFVSSEDKAMLINAATLLVAAPEKMEHFGIIYAEALAAGTPPVAYSGGGVGSVVPAATGVLTERDPTKLGEAVRDLLGDPLRREAMALTGRMRAEQEYSYPQLVSQLEGWLNTLCERHCATT